MKKEEFNYLYSFNYKGKDFIFLTSKKYPFYFLEYDYNKKKFEYPNFETFKDLFNKFYSNDNILAFNKIENTKKIREKISKVKINIKPLIRAMSGGLLTLTAALSICGCMQIPKNSDLPQQAKIAEMPESSRQDEIHDYFYDYNIDVTSRDYNGNDYIFIKNFMNNNDELEVTIQNLEEFRKLMDIKFIPSWDDVEQAFRENENIDEEKKKIIFEGLKNMKDSDELKGMDLSVLYINAKKMKFEYIPSAEIKAKTKNDSSYAFFNIESGTVYLPNDKSLKKFEFTHEVLGHGSLAFREKRDNTLYVFDCTNKIMLPTDQNYTGYSFGSMVSEGEANMIAHIATKDYSVESYYELFEEELRVIARLCNVSLGELFNHKGISLYDLMYKNNINTPVEYIYKVDGIMKGKQYCKFSDLMECLFQDATEEQFINADAKKQEEIIKETINIIRNSNFKDKGSLNFKHSEGSIDYDFEEAANNYEKNMNNIRRNK